MPDLTHTLQGTDLGFLRLAAGAWGFDLNAPDARSALPLLVDALRDAHLVCEVTESLPQEAQAALQALIENEGRILWATFARRFGEVRPLGPARRDRERPDIHPVSATEILWYRVLIGKAFFHFPPAEPQEYAYIPDDLLELLPALTPPTPAPYGRPASPGETADVRPARAAITDHATTLLAALRIGLPRDQLDSARWGMPVEILQLLLRCAGLLDPTFTPVPEATRSYLEVSRSEALVLLAQTWQNSPEFNELNQLPGLKLEGGWANDPLHTRQFLIDLVCQVPQDTWWNLPAFVAAVKDRQPDFQRPAGDYDSWFIRRESDNTYLRGFGNWDVVDGALVAYLITGPMHWLGMVDLAAASPQSPPDAFRLGAWGLDLLHDTSPQALPDESGQLTVTSTGIVRLPANFSRSARYQIARFCQWETEQPDGYRYRLLPSSLERARQQGLRVNHLVGLLRKYAAQPLPPTLLQALERWDKFGAQAGLEEVKLLRLASADLLVALRKTRAARYLGEALSPTVVVVKSGGESAVRDALAELGHLVDF